MSTEPPRCDSFAAPRFLCIGDIDVDVLIRVDRLPTRDGKVNGTPLQRAPGGMAANVAVGLARLGAAVRVLGRVGDDDEAAFALAALAAAGVETDFVTRMAGTRTFTCLGLITPDGEKSLVKLMSLAYRPSVEDVSDAACRAVTHLHLTSAGDGALCRRVVAAALHVGATASLDVERADCLGAPEALAAAVAGFDLLFCNAEARAIMDLLLPAGLASCVPVVITTLGAEGSSVETGGERLAAPGFPADVRDTTGAGDCFAAACLHGRLVQHLDWAAALRFANRAASLSIAGYGAQSALPTLDEVNAALVQ